MPESNDSKILANLQHVVKGGQHKHFPQAQVLGKPGVDVEHMGGAKIAENLAVTGAATCASTLGVTGATTCASTLAVTGASTLTGGVINKALGAKNRVGKNVAWTTGSTIVSGALAQPANTRITGLTAIITTATTHTSGTLGVTVGTAANGVEIVASDPDNLHASGTAGVVNTAAELAAVGASAGAGLLVPVSLAIKSSGASAREVHFTVTSSGGAFTAGAVTFIMEYENLLAQA